MPIELLSESMTFVVGYGYTGWILTLIMISILGFSFNQIYIVGRGEQLWKFKLVRVYLGVVVFLTCFALVITLWKCFTVYKYRKALVEGNVNYIEGGVVYEEIPLSKKAQSGPKRPIARVGGILFTLRRSPSECINKFLSGKTIDDDQKGLIYRIWYVKKPAANTFIGMQDFAPCIVKLEILSE